uniref:Ig-like domain-containing protein n=1 Tax=Callorhinchus milii TaxID=7868 RepID=A0A4W3J4A3_CALMI
NDCRTATLSCNYSADFSNVFMYWYRQYPGEPPLYTRRHDYDGETFSAEFAKQRFSTTLDTNTKRSSVTVLSVALSDTATYYCAITRTVFLSDYNAVHKPPKRRETVSSQHRSGNSTVQLVTDSVTDPFTTVTKISVLTIADLRLTDSAMYHCALSLHHSDTKHRKPRTITIIIIKRGKGYSTVSDRQTVKQILSQLPP